MVYQLKLLLAVLIAASMFAVFARPLLASLLGDLGQRKAWVVLLIGTVVCFLARLPYLFFFGVACTAIYAYRSFGGDTKARLAAFMLLLLAFPPIQVWIEGFGGINQILSMDPMRVLVLTLLLPEAVKLMFRRRVAERNPFLLIDLCLLAYVVLGMLLSIHASMTYLLRFFVLNSITTLIPYYVVTRGLKSMDDLRFVGAHAFVGCIFVTAVAAAETAMQRALYEPLQYIYGVSWQVGGALVRGGLIRVEATTAQPIILGFVLIVAMGLWFWLLAPEGRRTRSVLLLAAFIGALVSTWSRGPWLGAALFALSLLCLRWMSSRTFMVALVALVVVGIGVKVTGADNTLLEYMKSASTQEDFGTIAYRKQLLDTALALIQQSPFLGVPNYLDYMQDLRQGQGMIDLVNTYLVVTLNTGLVGLVLYLLPQIIVIVRLLQRIQRNAASGQSTRFAKVFISISLGAALTLFTASALNVIPYLMIFLQGASLAYLAMGERDEEKVRVVKSHRPGAVDFVLP